MPGRANIKRIFQSGTVTGTGSAVLTPHTLGYKPRVVITSATELTGIGTIVQNTHTATDISTTAVSGDEYQVTAW